ncbi:phage tail assembly chaperone [Sphingomonas panni]|uniref:phage tail assembly chaperone n=1 Tax=Sphingomonas panni TaxID=237612 RepID=UPI001F5BB074|nr:phage tail assembly chaperone [Sphingomonas panni]
MFVADPNPTFTHEVTARVPVNGGYEEQKFKVTYRVLTDEQLGAFDLNDNGSAAAFLRQAVTGLDDIAGADKKALPYSDNLRDQIIGLPYARVPMVRGYFEAVYPARLGN